MIHPDGLLLAGNDGKFVNVKLLNVEGKFVQVRTVYFLISRSLTIGLSIKNIKFFLQASKYGQAGVGSGQELVLTDEEKAAGQSLRQVWADILKIQVFLFHC